MIRDEDIYRLESEPARIAEDSFKVRVRKIYPQFDQVVHDVARGIADGFIRLAVEFFPRPTVGESVQAAMEHLHKKLGEEVARQKKERLGKKPQWFIS
jgi:hypothetical protein